MIWATGMEFVMILRLFSSIDLAKMEHVLPPGMKMVSLILPP